MKTPKTTFGILLVILACFGPLPGTQAVVPPPDGGYPGGNTAEGQNALLSLTAGVHNTAVGYLSLKSDTTGGYNTAVGSGTLFANTGDGNTATGVFALLSNTGAAFNTANGALALFSNTTGSGNTASGFGALENNIDGNNNGALGASALLYHETGDYNYAIGSGALEFNVSGIRNTAVGHAALRNSTGSNNIAIGTEAGVDQTTGPNNIYIGDLGVPGEDNVIAIGAAPASGIPYTECYIGGIFGAPGSGVDIGVTEFGRLGPFASSARFKDDIKPMEKASEAIFRLRPVTFRYKKKVDAKGGVQFGFVAEEVAKVNPELVVSDGDGKPYSVRYRDVTAMLLNEFLKEHKKVQKLESRLAHQEKQIEPLTEGLQKVSVHPEMSKALRVSFSINPHTVPESKTMKGPGFMKNRNTIFTPILLVISCFGVFPGVQAVVPPPDGGYPGGNTAEGAGALLSLTTGTYNTAVGFSSLGSNTEGGFNTGVGAGALLSNNSGRNTATGAGTLLSNTTGPANTANGAFALLSNTEGGYNTAVGDRALLSHTAGDRNTAIGASALFSDTIGAKNTAIGAAALFNNTIGELNTAMGDDALASNTIGIGNTATGFDALFHNTTGYSNTAAGAAALYNNSSGFFNTALGVQAGFSVSTANSVICIGTHGENVSDSCYIGNIWNQPGGSQAVYVNSVGKLGAQVSSRRFKDDIQPINQVSEAIHRLRPVSFRYKAEVEPTRPVGFGLIAEEVEKVNPDLVSHDEDGKPLSVHYDQINAMLLNEFLKEHKRVQDQGATIAELKKEVARLTATVKEQATQIQKVKAELKVSKATPNLVRNSP